MTAVRLNDLSAADMQQLAVVNQTSKRQWARDNWANPGGPGKTTRRMWRATILNGRVAAAVLKAIETFAAVLLRLQVPEPLSSPWEFTVRRVESDRAGLDTWEQAVIRPVGSLAPPTPRLAGTAVSMTFTL